MAHFAKLNNANIVTQVIVVGNKDCLDPTGIEKEAVGIDFCRALFGNDTTWKQTSYNGNMRKNYAGIGYVYDSLRDAFIAPKPYASWLLNEDTCKWEPPVPYPNDGDSYCWDENNRIWVKLEALAEP